MRYWLMVLLVAGELLAEIPVSSSSSPKSRLSGPEINLLLKNGTRVVRGKDWKWGNQDGGEGGIGTVYRGLINGWVRVKWDSGESNSYRMGNNDQYELDLADLSFTSRPETKTTTNKMESTTYEETITTAQEEIDTTLRDESITPIQEETEISTTQQETKTSPKETVTTPQDNSVLRVSTTSMVYRSGPELATLMKVGTSVVRGKDWDWGDQDGGSGKKGKILSEVDGGWVNVEWESGGSNAYRMGSDNKYDLYLAPDDIKDKNTILNFGPDLVTLMTIGTRVVRGKDWDWADQDGGVGEIGTITKEVRDGWIGVKWNSGGTNSYRMGHDDKYDLYLAQTNPSPTNTSCIDNILSGPQIASVLKNDTRVVRGQDWKWDTQDGGAGEEGRITDARADKGWVRVKWDLGHDDLYRMGHEGMYDLQLACSEFLNKTSRLNILCAVNNTLTGPQLASVFKIGTRVVRGQDWKWDSQDGGPGHEGYIASANDGNGWFKVEWDAGSSNLYRMGYDDKYDLKLACSDRQTKIGHGRATCTANALSGPEIVSILKVGTRVFRGQDWEWGSQDGGPGHEGRITDTKSSDGWVDVEWDSGYRNSYRMGFEKKYDLRLACSDTEDEKSHRNASCATKALSGPEIVSILKIGTRVIRGQDWKWDSQDGGPGHEGRITDTKSGDGWVDVEWDSGDRDSYRMGFENKYDLRLACPDIENETSINTESRKSSMPDMPPTTTETSIIFRNIQEGNELFGQLVGKEIANVPRSRRIETMQEVLEIFKKKPNN